MSYLNSNFYNIINNLNLITMFMKQATTPTREHFPTSDSKTYEILIGLIHPHTRLLPQKLVKSV